MITFLIKTTPLHCNFNQYFNVFPKGQLKLYNGIYTILYRTMKSGKDVIGHAPKILSTFIIKLHHIGFMTQRFGHIHKVVEYLEKNNLKAKLLPGLTPSPNPSNVKDIDSNTQKSNFKAIDSVPFTEFLPSDHPCVNPVVQSNAEKVIGFLNHIIPKPNYTVEVLRRAETEKLIRYEDTKEFPSTGSPILTPEGIKFYKKLSLALDNAEINLPKIDNIIYQVGLLKIANDTLIPLSKQMHLVVAYNVIYDTYICLGTLTSEDNILHTKLSSNQPIGEKKEKEKAQFFKPMNPYIVVEKKDFDVHLQGTKYIQTFAVTSIIKNIQNKTSLDTPPILYNPNGITPDDLTKMLELKANEPIPQKKKISHFEQEKQNAKTAKLAELTKNKKSK
jgi:hypothetical protein